MMPMASRNPFECLPLEMQMECLSYTSPRDLMNFRLVSRSCNEITKNLNLLSFRNCSLSDSTYTTILDSQGINVSAVEVSDLMTPRFGLSQRRGLALLDTRKVVIGPQVSDKNLSTIFSFCTQVVEIGFKNSEPRGISSFLDNCHSAMHSTITSLTLSFDICGRNDFKEISKLLLLLRLESLKKLTVVLYASTTQRGDTVHVLNQTQLRNFHRLYFVVHKMVVIHQMSLEEVDYNFSGMIPRGSLKLSHDETEKYKELRGQLYCIYKINKFSLNRFHEEGSESFNLSIALLLSQKNLVSLSLTTLPSSHTSGIEYIIERNKASLRELILDRPQFSLPLVQELKGLQILKVRAYRLYRYYPGYVMNEEDLDGLHDLPLPRGLQELRLEVDSLCCENEVDPLHSFICASLRELRVVELSLKMENVERHVYPSEAQFVALIMDLPKLEVGVVNFFARYRDGSDTEAILEKRERLVGLCQNVRGLKTELNDELVQDDEPNYLFSHKYTLVVRINRKIFRGMNH